MKRGQAPSLAVPLVVGSALVGVGAWLLWRQSQGAAPFPSLPEGFTAPSRPAAPPAPLALPPASTPDDQPVPGSVPGVEVSPYAQLGARQWYALALLRQAAPPTLPIYVTSGLRTYAQQAAAMKKKVDLGEPLRKLYGEQVEQELMSVPFDQWEGVVRSLYARRLLRPGGHIDGGAVDLRTKNLTPGQVEQLLAAARAIGAKPGIETTPPHMHVSALPRPTAGPPAQVGRARV